VTDERPAALPHTALSRRIDAFLGRLEAAVSWVWLLLLAVIVVNVVARYAFGEGRIEFEELQWHLYSVGFLVGIAAAVAVDVHVRVDVVRERFSPRTKAWIELYGLLLLFLPFVTLVLVYSVPFVALAYQSGEVSVSAGGLPYRWIIKGALGAGFALLGLAGVSRLLRVSAFLFGAPEPIKSPGA
jgi:TRAP-type mannitol/chloroaromatic compound transport system permease small subunit